MVVTNRLFTLAAQKLAGIAFQPVINGATK
jgi:hypothetical protein